MPLHVLGLNHTTAPVDVRERVAVAGDAQGEIAAWLKRQTGVQGAVVVSTCNRTEVYAESADAAPLAAALAGGAASTPARLAALNRHVYQMADDLAVAHAFRVASGLDSMVLGEPQILGQIKHAVAAARAAGALSPQLDRMFQATFAAAKAVRSDTAIGEASISLAAAAVKVAERIFERLSSQRLLLVGVGEMVQLAATHFAKQRPVAITIVNRTPANAAELAAMLGAQVAPLSALPELLASHDIVVSGTASPLPVIGKGMVERAMAKRRTPMLLVDFAVPRDVEAEVAQLDDTFVFTVDDLGKLVQQGQDQRALAAREAQAIITEHVSAFSRWLVGRESAPLVATLRNRGEHYRQIELERAQRLLASGATAEAALESLARALTNKFLHHPTQAARNADLSTQADLARAIEYLYPADAPAPGEASVGLPAQPHKP